MESRDLPAIGTTLNNDNARSALNDTRSVALNAPQVLLTRSAGWRRALNATGKGRITGQQL